MAISAERFKYLDKETNVPVKQFTDLVDNQVYTKVSEAVETSIDKIKDAEGLLKKVATSIKELKKLIQAGVKGVLDTIKKALNGVIDFISNLELPDMIKDLFGMLKDLDLGGVKDFLQDLLHVGEAFLCDNLDFLKLFMLGYSINGNILAGLLTALLFSWLDRFCKGMSKKDQESRTKTEQLEAMVPPKGMEMNVSNTFENFTNTYADFLRASDPISLPATFSDEDIMRNVINGDIETTMVNLRESEISSSEKKRILQSFADTAPTYPANSKEQRNLLAAKAKLTKLPLISVTRRDKNIKFSNLGDQLGSMAKNLVKVDIKNINTFNLNDIERKLFGKIQDFKKTAETNPDIRTRSMNSGSFKDFDFKSTMPALTIDEEAYLRDKNGTTKSHRLHDMHPTTSVFLEA